LLWSTYSNLDEVVGLPCCLVFLDHLGESGIAEQFKDKAVLDKDLKDVKKDFTM
jgi:hypothetical protein